MSKTAQLTFDARAGKWLAVLGDQVLAASTCKDYIIKNIQNGRCAKAVKAGVTNIIDARELTPGVEKERFSINERFDFLTSLVQMVADRTSPSLIVTGEGGLGKTYTVNKALKDAGLKLMDDEVGLRHDDLLTEAQARQVYALVKGYSTPKGLYRTLYENRNKIIVFDDCDSVLRDPTALNLLKGALDSYDKRVISWNAEAFGDDDLPRRFEFKGGIIFISNLPLRKIDQAVRSRSLCVDLSMNTAQKIERMSALIEKEEFLPEHELSVKRAALSFIEEMKDIATELSLRTLISVTKVASRGGNWKRLAEYVLTSA